MTRPTNTNDKALRSLRNWVLAMLFFILLAIAVGALRFDPLPHTPKKETQGK